MARSGISGLAVTVGAAGLYLVYAGIRSVPLVAGLRDLAKGRVPAGQDPQPTAIRRGARMGQAAADTISTASAAGLIRPVPGSVGDGFGALRAGGRRHKGIDISASTGTPVHAAASGTVIGRGYDLGAGNYVNLGHEGTVQKTKYFHLSDFAVGHGDNVNQGQVIGYVGSTGDSSGPHLHFEVWVSGAAVDPMIYLPG